MTEKQKPNYVLLNSIYLNHSEILFLQGKTEKLPIQHLDESGQLIKTTYKQISGCLTKLEIYFFLSILAYVQREYFLRKKPKDFEPVFTCKSLTEFLGKVGRSTKGRNYEKARSAILKLQRILLSFEDKNRCFGYEILKSFEISKSTGEFTVTFNKDWFLSHYNKQYNKIPLILFDALDTGTQELFFLLILQNKHIWIKQGNLFCITLKELKKRMGIAPSIVTRQCKYQLKILVEKLKQRSLFPDDYNINFLQDEVVILCDKEEPHDLDKYKCFWGVYSC